TGVFTLYVEPTSTSGRSSFSCIRTTFCSERDGASASRFSGSSRATAYFTILLSILMPAIVGPSSRRSQLPVVAFLQRVEQIGGGVHLAVVLDLLVALRLDDGAVLERELVGRVLEILLLHEHALERLGVEAERRAPLQALLVG